ncbi:MAG: hypothetical protein EBR06_05610 [Acidimicrobiia bacterium]|nr:hypothetical protein [Acidimicrobiia bacterium]
MLACALRELAGRQRRPSWAVGGRTNWFKHGNTGLSRGDTVNRNVAAIDIGSNSTNLLVVDAAGNELVREVNVTALGDGVARTGVLSQAAIERTLEVIDGYARVVASHAADLHITGTAACRMASNTSEFFVKVKAATGTDPRGVARRRSEPACRGRQHDGDRHRRRINRTDGRHSAARDCRQRQHALWCRHAHRGGVA